MTREGPMDEWTIEETAELINNMKQQIDEATEEVRRQRQATQRAEVNYERLRTAAAHRMQAMYRLLKLLDDNHTSHGARHGQLELLMVIAQNWSWAGLHDSVPDIDPSDIPF